jgi:hypothetical protein
VEGVVHAQAPDVRAARELAARATANVQQAASFQQLDPNTRAALLRDLGTIERALGGDWSATADPYALNLTTEAADGPHASALDTPADLARGPIGRRSPRVGSQEPPPAPASPIGSGGAGGKAPPATETIAGRAGALSDEIDFPGFVASLVHGTFDAIVDATIRQMEAFADLISAVAKDVDGFTRDNVTLRQVRAQLAEQHPADLQFDTDAGQSGRAPLRARNAEDPPAPDWLADYGLAGEPLTDEMIEEQLVPAARRAVGEQRLQTLATMVLLGMSRVNVRDGTISARVRFRAAAADRASVDYSTSEDAGTGGGWASRGSGPASRTFVSTVGVNVQAESDLKVELFGQVSINFVSETLPLDRFADAARLALVQRNARWSGAAAPGAGGTPVPPANGSAAPALGPEPTVSEQSPPPSPGAPAPGAGTGG